MAIGSMLSIPVVPYVADIMGRRAGVVVGCIIMLFGVAMVSIGYRIALFVVGRIILGFGLGIAQVNTMSYHVIFDFDRMLIDDIGMLSTSGH